MSLFRVTQEFAVHGDPPTQAMVDRLLGRLRSAAPDADAALEMGIGRMQVLLTVSADGASGAASQAESLVAAVIAAHALRTSVEPAQPV